MSVRCFVSLERTAPPASRAAWSARVAPGFALNESRLSNHFKKAIPFDGRFFASEILKELSLSDTFKIQGCFLNVSLFCPPGRDGSPVVWVELLRSLLCGSSTKKPFLVGNGLGENTSFG